MTATEITKPDGTTFVSLTYAGDSSLAAGVYPVSAGYSVRTVTGTAGAYGFTITEGGQS